MSDISDKIHHISSSPLLGVDIETYDPHLRELGAGVYRKDGYITGVALSSDEIGVYLDIDHPDTTPEAKEKNIKIIQDVLKMPTPKVGARFIYDLDWLINGYGFTINGAWHDVQYAEPLIDEYRQSYSLAALAQKYELEEKASSMLTKYCIQQGWIRDGQKIAPQKFIYKMPSAVVKRYAELDSMLAVQIFKKQLQELEKQELFQVYDIESGLLPLLVQMRRNGVRIDIDRFNALSERVAYKILDYEKKLYAWAGGQINLNAPMQIAKILDKNKIDYPRNPITETMRKKGALQGTPNLNSRALKKLEGEGYEFAHNLLKYRHYVTMQNLFLTPYKNFIVDGRIHADFNPLRDDNYGTVSGRFSSSNPNLQQVSAKEEDGDDILSGKVMRSIFIPEDGHLWGKYDYSQVEYRIQSHYATGPKSDEIRAKYCSDPTTDYHQHIQDETGLTRRQAKCLNFGCSYFMGWRAMGELYGWSDEQAQAFYNRYFEEAPYLRVTQQKVLSVAKRRGYIKTLLGRRARVHPSRKIYSLYNRLIQGTAADIMKKALVDAYNAGIFKVLIPHITVHDEIDVSKPLTKEADEAAQDLKNIMENCVKLKVPLLVDPGFGKNWAEAE